MLAFISLVFDREFVVHDVRLIRGRTAPFVAMPDRPSLIPCQSCSMGMPARAKYCSNCRAELESPEEEGRDWVDVAHPISKELRRAIHERVMSEYAKHTV